MDDSTIFAMTLGMLFTWGIPLLIIISIVILYRKVNRIEKKLEEKEK